jgi:hypothetical protein
MAQKKKEQEIDYHLTALAKGEMKVFLAQSKVLILQNGDYVLL